MSTWYQIEGRENKGSNGEIERGHEGQRGHEGTRDGRRRKCRMKRQRRKRAAVKNDESTEERREKGNIDTTGKKTYYERYEAKTSNKQQRN